MPIKLLVLCFCLALVRPSFSEVVRVNTSEPASMPSDMIIDISDMSSVQEISLEKGKSLLITSLSASVKVLKDSKTGMNHYNALIGYNLSIDGVKQPEAKFLYFQCPISRHTYIDRSVPYYEVLNGKKIATGTRVSHDTLERTYVTPGYYRFLSSSKNANLTLGSDFPMAGGMYSAPDIELMCLEIAIIHLKHLQAEHNRNATLRKFKILE